MRVITGAVTSAATWALSALALSLVPSAAMASGYVLGDSLGVGVAQVSHLKGLARISVHIRGPKALHQIAQTPPNSTVFLVLGTNDANGSIARLDKSIDDIVNAAEKKHIALVWMGPPCVRKSWDTRSRELDAMLRQRFENTSVRYVSMRDEVLCSGNLQERDGVHLKMKGYVHMWEKARAAADFALASVEGAAHDDNGPDHTSAIKTRKVERIPLPRRRTRPRT